MVSFNTACSFLHLYLFSTLNSLPFLTFVISLCTLFFLLGEGSGPHKKKKSVVIAVGDEEKKRVVDFVVKEENGVEVDAINNNTLIQTPCYYHKCCVFSEAQRGYRSQSFDFGGMMDPEPYRCRRTDGKKWRCSRNVVPNQKYCERHMHRGCNRSRKHVEASQVNSQLTTKPSSGKIQTKITSSNIESSISNPNLLGTQLFDKSSCTPSMSHCVVNTSSTNTRLKNIMSSADYHSSFSTATAKAPKVTAFRNTTIVASGNRSTENIYKKDNQSKSCIGFNVGVKSGGKGSINCDDNSISTGIGFSPRSVLQVSGCNNLHLNDRNNVDLESGRCRRTDGKKWRCKSAVVPGQKYCATHMHRGSKRRFTEHKPAATDSAVTIAQLPCSTAATDIPKVHCSIPNTNLSMPIPASTAPLIKCDEKSPCSSDTETTITDTMNEYSYASS
ncbi:PREDICTED: growth-regulating factor 9-like isoform X2 [Lupinus angustifolius]|uniref:growth-regulating factor 9-like isoform X2 n=1 Tax=Lupinus angustifolius TaxID=3871 RepID=UPI00092E2390|nr:PREDICTED: growth-regulating factor 9-like isoform X2 [Lupinus angustifolius]